MTIHYSDKDYWPNTERKRTGTHNGDLYTLCGQKSGDLGPQDDIDWYPPMIPVLLRNSSTRHYNAMPVDCEACLLLYFTIKAEEETNAS